MIVRTLYIRIQMLYCIEEESCGYCFYAINIIFYALLFIFFSFHFLFKFVSLLLFFFATVLFISYLRCFSSCTFCTFIIFFFILSRSLILFCCYAACYPLLLHLRTFNAILLKVMIYVGIVQCPTETLYSIHICIFIFFMLFYLRRKKRLHISVLKSLLFVEK